MKQYLRDKDELGSSPQMTYKQAQSFGTTMGGLCSICCNLFIMAYLVIMFIGFISQRNYSIMTATNYLPINDPEPYTLSATDFIPAVSISNRNDIIDTDVYQVNYFISQVSSGVVTPVSAITCDEYIEKYLEGTVEAAQVENLLEEMGGEPEGLLCPDLPSFELFGDFSTGDYFSVKIRLSDAMQDLYAEATDAQKAHVKAMIDSSQVVSIVFTTYFTTELWNENGFNSYIKRGTEVIQMSSTSAKTLKTQVQKNECQFYNFLWFDMSQFEHFYDGEDCSTYNVAIQSNSFSNLNDFQGDETLFSSRVMQSREYTSTQWFVQSLDIILGMIGGFIGLIWSILTNSLGGYESFKYTQSLISEIYSTTDQDRMRAAQQPTSLDGAKRDLGRSLETQGSYAYSYGEFLCTWLIKSFCCCFKRRDCFKLRMKRYKRHELALEQLSKESDFFKFLKLLRVSQFMSKLLLRSYQRQLIPYFRKYQLTALQGDCIKVKDTDPEQVRLSGRLLEGEDVSSQLMAKQLNLIEAVKQSFDSEENAMDLAILYEVTGYQGETMNGDEEFWANYANFKENASAQMAINDDQRSGDG